jgi:hypothetical protein
LFRLTRTELSGLHRDIAAALAAMPDSDGGARSAGDDKTLRCASSRATKAF